MRGDTSVVLYSGPRFARIGAIILSVSFGATIVTSIWVGIYSGYPSVGFMYVPVGLPTLGVALLLWVMALRKTSWRFSTDGITDEALFGSTTVRWDAVQSVGLTRSERFAGPLVLRVNANGDASANLSVPLVQVLSPEALMDCLRLMFDRLPPDVFDTSVALLYGFAMRSIEMRDSGVPSSIIASATTFDFERLQYGHAATPDEVAIIGEALALIDKGATAASVLGPLASDANADWDVLVARALCSEPSGRPEPSMLQRVLEMHSLPPEIRPVLESGLHAPLPGEHG